MPTRPEAAPAPTREERAARAEAPVALDVRDLKTYFPLRGTFLDRLLGREAGWIRAVDGVSFALRRGEILGLVGESGSGKSTLGRTLLRLVDPFAGSIHFDGQDITGLRESQVRGLRRRMQMVFQDPHASLNPAMDLESPIGHPLWIHGEAKSRAEAARRVEDALERVRLVPPERFMNKYPGELSGGQKQRAVIARAIITNPELLVLDEPVSMLDMSVRAKILDLLLTLKEEFGLTYVYITHDLATAKFFCDWIAIMYLGRIVEMGPAKAIYDDPKHPYTISLLKAVPEPDPEHQVPRDLPRGEVPDAVNPPLGCSFHPRCLRAFEPCGWEGRDLRELLERRWAGMSEADYEAERAIIGDLADFDVAATGVRVPAGKGRRGRDVLELLQQVQRESPDDPFWRGLAEMRAEDHAAALRFHDGIDPGLQPEGDVKVACHLWDPDLRPK